METRLHPARYGGDFINQWTTRNAAELCFLLSWFPLRLPARGGL
jgi:hypothetical protein